MVGMGSSCGCGALMPRDGGCPSCGVATTSGRRRPARRWHRRPAFVVALGLLALLVVALGAILVRAGSAVVALQTISSPPAVLSGADLGGSPRTRIDTSIAQSHAMPSGDAGGRGGWWNQARDVAAGAVEATKGVAVVAGIADEPSPEAMNILLLGVDARPGEAIDIGVRPDALAVLHLDPATGSCRLLAIPRDTRVELPGYGLTKVNHALAVGGIPYQRQVVEAFLGIAIDRYGLIDFAGIERLVDAVGGIAVPVAEPFTAEGITFAAGVQRLDGTRALVYARYRGGPDGDFGRIRRQQQVILALVAAAAGRDLLRDIDEVLPALRDHTRTDFSPVELAAFALRYRATCTEQTIWMGTLDGEVATFHDPLLQMDLSYVEVDPAEVRRQVAILEGA